MRFPNGSLDVSDLREEEGAWWTCTHCGQHVHPTAGTIFQKSSTSLHLWFYAIYLMTSTRCGISAKQMERELGVTYKTAWPICLIRNELMRQDDTVMWGAVEAHETYIGGNRRLGKQRKTGRPTPGETHFVPVLGVVQRGGHVFATKVRDLKQTTIYPHIEKRVLPAFMIYAGRVRHVPRLAKRGYQHRRIQHSQNVYVSGDAHTNTIEGF